MSDRYSKTDSKRDVAILTLERAIKSGRYDDGYVHIITSSITALHNAKDEDIDALLNTPPTCTILNSVLGMTLYGPHMLAENKQPVEEKPNTGDCDVNREINKEQPVLKYNNKKAKIGLLVSLLGFILSLVILGVSADSYNEEAGLFLGLPIFISSIVSTVIFAIKTTKAASKNRYINRKEKCYKKIDKIHGYYERGSITKEEFETLKKEILSEIEE